MSTFSWRTTSFFDERLLTLEELIKSDDQKAAMQFYSNWEATRHSAVGLIKEYLLNALRPTVAYPYILLLGLLIAIYLFK